MSYDLILKNGLVILESGEVKTDVAVKDGLITAIGTDLGEAAQVIDASGLVVSPGMVDAMFTSPIQEAATAISGKAILQEPLLVPKVVSLPLWRCL